MNLVQQAAGLRNDIEMTEAWAAYELAKAADRAAQRDWVSTPQGRAEFQEQYSQAHLYASAGEMSIAPSDTEGHLPVVEW